MLNVLAEGFHACFDGKIYFITFDGACLGNNSVRPAMVALTQAARQLPTAVRLQSPG